MSRYTKFIIILVGMAYLVSPWDILPESLTSYFGLIDDVFVISTLLYLIRYNRLPNFDFLKRFQRNTFKTNHQHSKNRQTNNNQQKTHTQSNSEPGNSSNAARNGQQKIKTPYEILGVSPNATQKEILQAYKAAAKKYHPDKLSHLGEEFAHLANEKFLEIQEAYDFLIKR